MTNPILLSLTEVRSAMRTGMLSPCALLDAIYAQIRATEHLNMFIDVLPAMDQAKEAFRRISKQEINAMEGIPISIKNNICIKGIKTTACSQTLANFIPGYTATIIDKLLNKAGAICVGTVSCDEFAMGSSNLTSAFGPVINPATHHTKSLTMPGGSSGGSAASVAAHTCFASIGSDTGGSIILPSSYCGVVGVRPTYGRCSRYGLIAFGSSFDQPGVLARTVQDACIVLDQMMGPDVKDMTSAKLPLPNLEAIQPTLKGIRIGFMKLDQVDAFLETEIKMSWQATIKRLEDAGAIMQEIESIDIQLMMAVYYVLSRPEAFSNLQRYDGIRYGVRVPGTTIEEMYYATRELFGDSVRNRIIEGAELLSSPDLKRIFIKALKCRAQLKAKMQATFKDVDAIITPTAATGALPINKPLSLEQIYQQDIFTVIAGICGICSMSVPLAYNANGLPFGMQILAGPFCEDKLIQVGKGLEALVDFKLKEIKYVNKQV